MNTYFLSLWVTQNGTKGSHGNRVVEIEGVMTEEKIRNQESIIENSFNASGVSALITNFIKME